eukprot:703456_1
MCSWQEDVDLYLFYMECANNTHKSDAKYHGNATENTNTSLKRMDNNGEYGVSDDVCAQNRSKCIANTIRFSATPRTALCIEYPTATPTIALCIEYFDFWTAADGVGCDSVIEQLQQCLHRIEECKDPSPTHTEHQQYPANQRQDTVAVKEKRHSIFSTFWMSDGVRCVSLSHIIHLSIPVGVMAIPRSRFLLSIR